MSESKLKSYEEKCFGDQWKQAVYVMRVYMIIIRNLCLFNAIVVLYQPPVGIVMHIVMNVIVCIACIKFWSPTLQAFDAKMTSIDNEDRMTVRFIARFMPDYRYRH